MNIDSMEMFSQIDRSDMVKFVLGLPGEIYEAVDIGNSFEIPRGYKQGSDILVTGMGGSGIPGDFLKALLSKELPVPLIVNKDYSVPRFTDKNTLVFAISYSGNTEETIAALKAANEVNARIIGITSGGKLLKLCQDAGTPFIQIPRGRQTRASFGYLLFSILTVLQRLDIVADKTIDVVRKVRQEIGPSVATASNAAKSLALKLSGKSVVIYGTHNHTDVAALRWKQQLNENSKMPARYEALPELNHNEIVAWDSPGATHEQMEVVFLRDEQELPQIKRRIEVTREFLDSRGISTTEVWSQGRSLLARLISLSYFSDFMSLYLALLNDVDPTPIEAIAYFKQKLAASEG
jgi:glucose/mannose-6-phosphate isomerase